MKHIRHIFLTGEKRIGKTTLWRKVLEQTGISPSGFQTLEYLVCGQFRGYRLHGLGTIPSDFGNDVPVSVFLRPRVHFGVPGSFDQFGVELLKLAQKNSAYIMMDELGSFEKEAAAFLQAVTACLDGECHVLGVLQKVDSPFLETIAGRDDVLVFTVTEENRDDLVKEVIAALKQLT